MELPVIACCLCGFTLQFVSIGFISIAPDFGTHQQAALLYSVQFFTAGLVLFPTAIAVDRYSSRSVMKFGLASLLVCTLSSGVSGSFAVQFFSRFMAGLATPTTFNASMACILETYKLPAQGRYIGTAQFIGSFGGMLGPLFFGAAYDLGAKWKLAQPQGAAVPPAVLLLLLCGAAVHNLPRGPRAVKASLMPPVREAQGMLAPGGMLEALFGVYVRVGAKSLAAASVCLVMFGNSQMLLVGSTLALHSMGYSATGLGAAAMIPTLGNGVACLLAGTLGSSSQSRLLILGATPACLALFLGLLCALFLAVSHAAASATATIAVIILATTGTSISLGFIDVTSIGVMGELAESAGLGMGSAVLASGFMVDLGMGYGPLLAPVFLRLGGFGALCSAAGLLALLPAAAMRALLPPSSAPLAEE